MSFIYAKRVLVDQYEIEPAPGLTTLDVVRLFKAGDCEHQPKHNALGATIGYGVLVQTSSGKVVAEVKAVASSDSGKQWTPFRPGSDVQRPAPGP